MPAALTLHAPAKLNLFLHVTGRRDNGYHELQTVFQLLDWGDQLTFTPNDSGAITLQDSVLALPAAENLVVRAARLLQREGDREPGQAGRGVHIALDKHIPTGGGLGGGSSNAATTLLALNHLWALGLSSLRLQQLGAGLGADVPVFLTGHSAWAEGIGDILRPIELPERWYLIVAPGCHVATGEIFSHRELTRNSAPIKMATFFAGDSRNDCQPLVRRLYPEVDKALNLLANFGEARLTGTGACVFASFASAAQATAAQGQVTSQMPEYWSSIVARGINTSPVPGALV